MTKRRTDIEEVRLDIERRGVKSAYAALVEICEDRAASAQARAASAIAIFRAAGLHDAKKRPTPDDDASNRSAPEWQQIIERLTRERDRLDAEIDARAVSLDDNAGDEDEIDVFG